MKHESSNTTIVYGTLGVDGTDNRARAKGNGL
jgi:hypothetical protein